MKSIKKYILILILLTLSSSLLFGGGIINRVTVQFSNFTSISQNIYVDEDINETNYQEIISLVSDAKQRIIDKFGSFSSNPTIIFTSTSEKAKKYGTNDFGSVVRLPWNQYIVFGSKGHNIDIVAHELLHAEIGDRLGYIITQFKLPVWIDEGIGMQVDYRKKYIIDFSSVSSNEIERVTSTGTSQIINTNPFWLGGEKQVIRNYQISKALVEKILSQNLDKSLYSMLDKIKKGESAENVFYYYQTQH